MAQNRDFCKFEEKLERELGRIKGSKDIPPGSKKQMPKFRKDLCAEGIGAARILKYLVELRKTPPALGKDLDKASAYDIKDIVRKAESPDISDASKLSGS